MTTNPAVIAAQALRQAANAVFDGLELLASSLTVEVPIPEPLKETETEGEVTVKAPARKPRSPKHPDAGAPPEEAPVATKVKTEAGATIEQIRTVLGALSKSGRAPEARAFLKKLGYTKLTDIPESLYDEVLPAAQELLDA